jgi:hypothetical protein
MSGDEDGGPLRWERGSAAEDYETRRAGELDKLGRWAAGQKHEPLVRAMEQAGVTLAPGEPVRGAWIVPAWWPGVDQPDPCCPWCQRPRLEAGLCGGCAQAWAEWPGEPAALSEHWLSLAPLARRLHLGIAHRVDPWTGEPVAIVYESAHLDDDGLAVARMSARSLVPRSSWDLGDPALG